jgi:serine/threonine-protein kinase
MGQVASPLSEVGGTTNLVGKYRLIASLGQGGMATVYLAVVMGNSGFRKLAVVKLLRPEIAVDTEFVSMFLDEARLCARLSHPNIVHTYDVGVDKLGHLLAMEYLDGVSYHAAISKLSKGGGPLKFPMHAKILLEVLEGLRYAHDLRDYDGQSLQIVHRDVTPQNIFLTYNGTVKLLDFGIAKTAASSVNTATGVIKGKLTYMAPEQARGDPVDARTDLYAVGVMLWEAIAGRRRWPTGLSQPALFLRLATGEAPEPPGAAAQGYPAELDAIALKSLSPKPEERFQTAAEFSAALEQVMHKMDPVSLRDLGTMLSDSFAQGRERMRSAIEEQFRTIDQGGPPSAPHQIPVVASPSLVTGSETFERPSPAAEIEIDVEPSRSFAPTAAPPRREPAAPQRRSRIALIAAGALTAAGLAIFLAARLFSKPAAPVEDVSHQAAQQPQQPVAPTSAPHPAVDLTQEKPTRDDTRASPDDSQRASNHHPEVRPPKPGPAPRGPTGHANTTPEPPVTVVTPPPPPPPNPDPTSTEPFRQPQGKPKVQLERDNPWP